MRRRLSLAIAFIGVLGLVGFAPVAQAGHDLKKGDDVPHEHSPAPPVPPQQDGVCAVLGTVNIGNHNGDGGVGVLDKNHNHYRFASAEITCVADPDAKDGAERYAGRYEVDAAGGTDGEGAAPQTPGPDHGENASVGWAHSSCYDDDAPKVHPDHDCDPPANHKDPKVDLDDLYDGLNENGGEGQCTNCGEIVVRGIDVDKISDPNDPNGDPDAANNWVKFCRGLYDDGHGHAAQVGTDCTNIPQGGTHLATSGGNVLAWGALTNFTGRDKNAKPADEVLCFLADLEFTPVPAEKFNTAALEGTALTWLANDKAACEGKKKPKP